MEGLSSGEDSGGFCEWPRSANGNIWRAQYARVGGGDAGCVRASGCSATARQSPRHRPRERPPRPARTARYRDPRYSVPLASCQCSDPRRPPSTSGVCSLRWIHVSLQVTSLRSPHAPQIVAPAGVSPNLYLWRMSQKKEASDWWKYDNSINNICDLKKIAQRLIFTMWKLKRCMYVCNAKKWQHINISYFMGY